MEKYCYHTVKKCRQAKLIDSINETEHWLLWGERALWKSQVICLQQFSNFCFALALNAALWQWESQFGFSLLFCWLSTFCWDNEKPHANRNYPAEKHWKLLWKLIVLSNVEKCTKYINSAGCNRLKTHGNLLFLGQNLRNSLRIYSTSRRRLPIEWVLWVLVLT